MTRTLTLIALTLAATTIAAPIAQASSGNAGSIGLARGILETQFGFSPSRAVAWTSGVCSYADKPSSCYLTSKQAVAQSYAEAEAMGARPLSSTAPTEANTPTETTNSTIGDVGLARGILDTQFGFSPSRAVAWTSGVCSYADKPSSCYLTPQQAAAQSNAEAQAIGAQLLASQTSSAPTTTSVGFQWGDAGIGAGAMLGLVLLLSGLAAGIALRNHDRDPKHA